MRMEGSRLLEVYTNKPPIVTIMAKVVSRMPIIIAMDPVKYTFNVQASDTLPLIVTGLFTIGPRENQGFSKYVSFVKSDRHRPCKCTFLHRRCSRVKELVMDVIKSEICVAAALKTMEEINRGATEFKQQLFEEIQLKLLDQSGLTVYNADFKQLKEIPCRYSVRLGWMRPLKLLFFKLRSKSKSDPHPYLTGSLSFPLLTQKP